MTTIEWARQYPEIAEKIFGCKVEELELLLSRYPHVATGDEGGYMTSEDKARLYDILKGE